MIKLNWKEQTQDPVADRQNQVADKKKTERARKSAGDRKSSSIEFVSPSEKKTPSPGHAVFLVALK